MNFTHSDNGCDKGKKLNRTVSKSWKYLEIKKKESEDYQSCVVSFPEDNLSQSTMRENISNAFCL